MSITGIPQIVTTESYLLKVTWSFLMILTCAAGFYNINLAVADYYKFDKITNIERVMTENMTFPAITICIEGDYQREHYVNEAIVETEEIQIRSDKEKRLENFLNFDKNWFYSEGLYFNATNHLEFFKFPGYKFECFRFNGFVNKSNLFKINTTDDYYYVEVKGSYLENINEGEYFKYTLKSSFKVFISDNYLDSLEKVEPLWLDGNIYHEIELERTSIEKKLPEPYNQCSKPSVDQPFHQPNCISRCLFKEIKNKYNCSFSLSLFAIPGLKECDFSDKPYSNYKNEFSKVCQKECPLESCYSEKFTSYIKTFRLDGWVDGYTGLYFSFGDLTTLNIAQIPKMDDFTFINNIGGGLGLFMGVDFPNLIEFFEFIIEIVSIVIIP